jgi:hypothetical protein
LLAGAVIIISGAVGRTELRPSWAVAGVLAGAALATGAAGAVGGPIEMAGIAGRLAVADPGRAPESGRAG